MKVVVITVSDRASKGIYEDLSGPETEKKLREHIEDLEVDRVIVPDDPEEILKAMKNGAESSPEGLSSTEGLPAPGSSRADVIITTGGTGIGPRDITPDVTRNYCDTELPGIQEILRSESYKQTTSAMLSRGYAGMKNKTIIVNVPGSVRGAGFCAELLAPVLKHGMKMLRGEDHGPVTADTAAADTLAADTAAVGETRITEGLLVYHDDATALMDYGIQIPVLRSRVDKTLQHLAAHPVIGPGLDTLLLAGPPPVLGKEDILRVHDHAYVERLYDETRVEEEIIKSYELISNGTYHRYDPSCAILPLSSLLQDMVKKCAGTYQAAERALETGFCYYFGGGFHHAHFDFGHGFCLINDSVIAMKKLQSEGRIGTGWIIDVDVHKGDGTAALTRKDPSVRTLSVHMARGWPLDIPPVREDGTLHPSFIESDVDIPIATGEEETYNPRLAEGLRKLETFGPADIAIVLAGADPYEKDELPSSAGINLTLEQLLERDLLIYRFLRDRRIPAAFIMAGGYGEHTWKVFSRFLETVLSEILENPEKDKTPGGLK